MRKLTLLAFIFLLSVRSQAKQVLLSLDPAQDRHPISQLSFGCNNNDVPFAPFRRMGGNRSTGYNWENNASSAGSDYKQNNDFWALTQMQNPLPGDAKQAPGAQIVRQVQSIRAGGSEPLVTLPMAGYVSADGNGPVSKSEKAPSRRWVPVFFKKPGAPGSYTYPPDTRDNAVYVDECVAYLVKSFQGTPLGKIKYYSLDNEPDIWSDGKGGGTHPLLHPAQGGYAEVAKRSIELASALLDVDPQAQIFGAVNYGFHGLQTFQDAFDAKLYNEGEKKYGWFPPFFLDQMRQAEAKGGRRLLHFYDVHYYSEAQGPGGRVCNSKNGTQDSIARMQAPRSLWDPAYVEKSWIAKDALKGPIKLLPRLKAEIAKWYPGTRLSVTEWDFGGLDHISGGLASADALGIFAREEVAACAWPMSVHPFLDAAFKLYLNYDGRGSKFGDTSIRAATSDVESVPLHAAQDSRNPKRITAVAINRNWSDSMDVTLSLPKGSALAGIRAYRMDETKAVIVPVAAPKALGESFSDKLPKLSATVYEIWLK